MTWLLVKVFLGKASDWIIAHWQLVLFALMSFAIWHYQSDYKSAIKALSDYKQAQIVAVAKQKLDNKAKFDNAVLTQAKSNTINNQQIADLHIDKATLTNAIKGYYETKPNKSSVVSSGGIVLPKSISDTSTSAEIASSEQGSASSGPIPDSTCAGLSAQLGTLQEATALETVLYNKAKARIDQDCQQIGCE